LIVLLHLVQQKEVLMKTVCNTRLFNCIVAVAAIAAFGSDAQAALSVTNPSFESPVIPDFAGVYTPSGWTPNDPSNNRRIVNTLDPNSSGITPVGTTGAQLVIIGSGFTLGDGLGKGADLYQNIGTTNSLGNVTLLVDTAERPDLAIPPTDITIGIWRDTNADSIPDSPLATLSVLAATETIAFLPKSVTALAVPSGTELYLRFTAPNSTPDFAGFKQTLIDNVRIVTVPEPASVLLLGFGTIVVGAVSNRRRD
jgi:hypothetical protein